MTTTPNPTPTPEPESRPSGPRYSKMVPLGSSFQDLFSGGRPVWFKILGAAIAAPVVAVVYGLRVERKGGGNFTREPLVLAKIIICASIVGALAGTALSMKDVVHARRAAGLPVSWPLRVVYCGGIYSAVFVWGPILLVAVMFGLILVL